MPSDNLSIGLQQQIRLAERSQIKGHRPAVLWFTGLSGSGKSTIADAVEYRLNQEFHAHTYLLDGDLIRTGINKDLDFSLEGRRENIRRIAEIARLFYDAGLIVLTAFISPLRADRDAARALIPDGGFFEIYVNAPLEVCEQRDVKGLYGKARRGLIAEFTGITSPYEEPLQPELVLDTANSTISSSVDRVIAELRNKNRLGS